MTDLFADYKKQHKTKKTLTIITASLVLAVSVNAFLLGTDTGARLQTSVMNSNGKSATAQKADMEIVSAGTGTDMLKLRMNAKLENASTIDLSLAFDPENVDISNLFSEDKDAELVKIANVPGVIHVTLSFKTAKNINEYADILSIAYKKKKSEKTVLNLIETQFKSLDGTIYGLTSKAIEF